MNFSSILDFIQNNPQYSPGASQAYGIPEEELNSTVYALAHKMANFIRGGISGKKQTDVSSVDQSELKTGISYERKHTNDESIAKKIALNNLTEIPDYYTRLSKMVEVANRENSAAAVPTKVVHTVTNSDPWSYKEPDSTARDGIPWNVPNVND